MATWNTAFEASPADGDNPSQGAGKIREIKVEVGDRGNREHTWGGTTAADGIHRAGSAKVYFTTATPTLQPDGTTSLTTTDKGRPYYKSSTGSMLMIHNGTGFVSTGVTLSTSQTIYGVKTFKSAPVFSSGINVGLKAVRTHSTAIIRSATSPSHDAVKAKLSDLIPNVGDAIAVNGYSKTADIVGGNGTALLYHYVQAVRVTATRITLYLYQLNMVASSGHLTTLTDNPSATITVSTGTAAIVTGTGFLLGW